MQDEQTKWQRGDLVQLKCGGPCMVVEISGGIQVTDCSARRIATVVRYTDGRGCLQRGEIPSDLLVPWAPGEDTEQWKAQCAAKHEAGAHVLTARRLLTTARNLVITSKLPGFEAKINRFLWDTEHYQKDADG